MQVFLTTYTTNPNEKFVIMGNRVKASVEAIETYHLVLDTRYHLYLFLTLYVPFVSCNLDSLFKLDSTIYFFKFTNKYFNSLVQVSFVIIYTNLKFIIFLQKPF